MKRKTCADYPFLNEIREDYRNLILDGIIKSRDKVVFICNKHGEYYQKLNKHATNYAKGYGCPKCNIEKRTISRTRKEYPFINEIREDYRQLIRNGELNNTCKVPFWCDIHKEYYWQRIGDHRCDHGCPKCGIISTSIKERRTDYPFMEEIREDYQLLIKNSEIGQKDKIPFICEKHGEYWQQLGGHTNNNNGCPKCAHRISKDEIEIFDYVKSIVPDLEVLNCVNNLIDDRKLEVDIYIPELKIGIEYNGLIWHSEKFSNDIHNIYNKMKIFNDIDIRIINIFEDEWYYKQNIVKSKLKHILGRDTSDKIYARKCIVKEISSTECKYLLDNNHIQGNDKAGYRYGLYYKNSVAAVMTFKKGKASQNSSDWEMSRYATNTNVVGGFDRLLKYGQNKLQFEKVVTFADLRWSDLNNNIYEKTGWTKEYTTRPNYFYVTNKEKCLRVHRYNFRKSSLNDKLETFDPDLTEVQNCNNNGYYRLFDCGNIKYVKTYDNISTTNNMDFRKSLVESFTKIT
jgi:hypothetical protein